MPGTPQGWNYRLSPPTAPRFRRSGANESVGRSALFDMEGFDVEGCLLVAVMRFHGLPSKVSPMTGASTG